MNALLSALKRGRGWRRLGVVLSVAWLVFVVAMVVTARLSTPGHWEEMALAGAEPLSKPIPYRAFWYRAMRTDSAFWERHGQFLQEQINRTLDGEENVPTSFELAVPSAEKDWTLRWDGVLGFALGPVAAAF